MTSDGELLRRYAEAGSEDEFAEVVRRHIDLVYSAALRQVNGDVHLAQDVAQTVFSDLARKAASVSGRPALTGWLYTSTHFAAHKAVRTEQRRRTYEQEADSMRKLLTDSGPELDWSRLRPVLDAVMHELNEADREAILLRFFENRRLAEIGERFGLSEDAARKRVERALDKLRKHFTRRGITTTAATLAVVIAAKAVQAAPVGLAAAISATAAVSGTAVATSTVITATKTIAMTTIQKTLIAAALAVLAGAGIYEYHRNDAQKNGGKPFLTAGQNPTSQGRGELAGAVPIPLQAQDAPVTNPPAALTNVATQQAPVEATPVPPQQAALDPKTPPVELPRDVWSDAGFATPADALKTRGWAVLNGNRERFAQSLSVTPGARKTLEDMLINMAETSTDPDRNKMIQAAINNKWGVEEGLLMPMMGLNQQNSFTGYRILSEQSTAPDQKTMEVETDMASAPAQTEVLKFQLIEGAWKVVIDEDTVKAMH